MLKREMFGYVTWFLEINSTFFLFLSISPSPFINFFSTQNLSIPPPLYFYQFLHLLIFINSSSSLFLSIPLPLQIYQFLLFLIFINSSSSSNLSIPPPPYFYQFLLLLIFINSLFLSRAKGFANPRINCKSLIALKDP